MTTARVCADTTICQSACGVGDADQELQTMAAQARLLMHVTKDGYLTSSVASGTTSTSGFLGTKVHAQKEDFLSV